MFKRLRERIAEEATKFPVGQLSNNSGKPNPEPESKPPETNSTEDLITLSDSSSVVVPHTSPQQFSIGEEEDGSLSEQSTPQKIQNVSSGDANAHHTPNSNILDLSFGQEYRPSKKSPYIPQSDIESEREDPPTLNLDGISKDQLMTAIQTLKARSYKYKNKYAEVVKNFKELREEKLKIENTLIENQDKGLRRIAELREQCLLEQKAKAHLEENLRLLLEEKDSRICVLETQINLLKEGGKSSSTKTLPEDCDSQLSDGGSFDTRSEDSATSMSNDLSILQEKVERLQHQISQDKKTISAQKEQISLLRKQNENLSQELEEKVKRLNNIKDEHESVMKSMQDQLKELEKQQEENVMSMAETKRNMHEELELKEKQLIKAEEESKQYQALAEKEKEIVSELKKQYEEKVKELQRQLEVTERTLEEEKQSLLHELAQGKTAAINLVQQECLKKVAAVEETWIAKWEAHQLSCGNTSETQIEELRDSLKQSEEKLKKSEDQIKEQDSLVSGLEKENASLKNSVEKLESVNLEARHEESLKCMKDKLQNAEKNYKTQVDEMKIKINQLEKENSNLVSEKENLLLIHNRLKELKSGEEKVQSELKSKEEELKVLKEKLDTSNKEQVEKIHTFQESMKDKENMILKLKANIESISKENKENVEELQKKIKRLEVEREQLMLQAQERVSATEAKCREDIKSLQEKCDKLLLENSEIEKLRNQLDESLLVAESNQVAANQNISLLKDELVNAQKKLADAEKTKLLSESEFSNKLEKLQQENKLLLHNSDHVERLKAEKEELNEKLKTVVQQVNKINVLQTERDALKKENDKLSKEINHLKTVQNDSLTAKEKLKSLESAESAMKEKIEQLNSENEKLKSEILSIKNSFKGEKDVLLLEKENLLKRIEQLENCVSDPQNTSVQNYLETLKKEYEMAIKAKDDDMLCKLKQLVRDFSIQMDVKDKDSEQMMTELMEKNQYIEEKLQKEHAVQMQTLREDLLEKECALEEMRDSYEEALQEKDAKISEQELIIKSLSQKDNCGAESVHGTAESSDWDDTWVVPDEVAENSSPNDNTKSCDEYVKQIESLQEELSKSNSEIKELKVLLRLSPPESIVNNNNRRDSLQSLPEPTEFEYLKNIIYEYMMGKEPVTLAKVIAAVLRFNDVQTQQVIRREEARHPTR